VIIFPLILQTIFIAVMMSTGGEGVGYLILSELVSKDLTFHSTEKYMPFRLFFLFLVKSFSVVYVVVASIVATICGE